MVLLLFDHGALLTPFSTAPAAGLLILAANSGGERLELASDVRTGRLVGDLGRALRLEHG
jgi:hypothetical protein